MKFIKDNWFSILLVAILIFLLLYTQKQNEELVKQVKSIELLNKKLEKQSNVLLTQIDSLSNLESEVIEVIKEIKIKEYEASTAVDTMSISDIQGYFTGRYEK